MTITLASLQALRASPGLQTGIKNATEWDAAQKVVLQRRNEVWGAMCAINDAMTNAGAPAFTKAQTRDYDRYEGELNDLEELSNELGRWVDPAQRRGIVPEQQPNPFARARGGVAVLNRDESFRAAVTPAEQPGEEPLRFGPLMRGLVTGDWSGVPQNALTEGTLGAGGYLVPTPLSTEIIDRARNLTRVIQAGARTVPMESQTLKMARVAGDPTAAWHSEGASIALSDMTLEQVTFTARTLAARVKASRELLEDSKDVDDVLMNAFAEQFALSLDTAALYGSGTPPEPRGVKNASGITTTSLGVDGTTAYTWDDVLDAFNVLWTYNFAPSGIIWAPRTRTHMYKLKDSEGQYLAKPDWADGVPDYVTNQVPITLTQGANTDSSDIFVGQWSELLIGIRHRFEVQVLRERSADTGEVEFLAWFRGDVQVARPKAFNVLVGARS